MAKAKKNYIVEYFSVLSDVWVRSFNEDSYATYTKESATRRAKYSQKVSQIGLEYRIKEIK